jgi:hypothetical protein
MTGAPLAWPGRPRTTPPEGTPGTPADFSGPAVTAQAYRPGMTGWQCTTRDYDPATAPQPQVSARKAYGARYSSISVCADSTGVGDG